MVKKNIPLEAIISFTVIYFSLKRPTFIAKSDKAKTKTYFFFKKKMNKSTFPKAKEKYLYNLKSEYPYENNLYVTYKSNVYKCLILHLHIWLISHIYGFYMQMRCK